MATGNRDQAVLGRINQLVAEEDEPYAKGQLSESDQGKARISKGGARPVLGFVEAAAGVARVRKES